MLDGVVRVKLDGTWRDLRPADGPVVVAPRRPPRARATSAAARRSLRTRGDARRRAGGVPDGDGSRRRARGCTTVAGCRRSVRGAGWIARLRAALPRRDGHVLAAAGRPEGRAAGGGAPGGPPDVTPAALRRLLRALGRSIAAVHRPRRPRDPAPCATLGGGAHRVLRARRAHPRLSRGGGLRAARGRRAAGLQRVARPAAAAGRRGDHARAAGLNRYPDPTNAAAARRAERPLRRARAARIAIGNGSCDILLAAGEALLEPGAELVYAWPSFSVYPHLAAASGATRRSASPLDDDAAPRPRRDARARSPSRRGW